MITTGLIGHPTDHSFSPAMFNRYSKYANFEYSHIKMDIPRENLNKAINSLKILSFRGFNVTLPYKIEIIKYIDHLDHEARSIGAVNTVLIKNGILYGFNTDAFGALMAIENGMQRKVNKNDNVLILGTGGASRAVIHELLKKTKNITVCYREKKSVNTVKLMKQYEGILKFAPYSQANEEIIRCNLICNTTSVGMNPNKLELPVSKNNLLNASKHSNFTEKFFFDAIFSPFETKFLKISKKLGANTAGGLDMMLFQGIKAFELWTGKKISSAQVSSVKEELLMIYDK